MSLVNKLTEAYGYDTKNMIFSDPIGGKIPNSNPPLEYKRILISTKNGDGTRGDLILPTTKLFSFGISENLDMQSKKSNGYVLPIVLYTRDAPKDVEKEWVKTFNNIVEKCKDHLVQNREEIEQYDLTRNDLKRFNPLYYKRDKKNRGKIIEGTGPTIYTKLIVSKKLKKIMSMFYDLNTEDKLDPLDLIGKYCHVKAAIKIESIFIGNKISLQVKLYEAEVELMQDKMRRLLRKPTSRLRTISSSTLPMMEKKMKDEIENKNENKNEDEDEDDNSVGSIEDEMKKISVKPKPKLKKIRKVKKVRK